MARRKSDDTLLKECLHQLASSERHMEPILEKVRRARKVYLGTSNPNYGKPRDMNDPRDWRSRNFPPIAFEQAEILSAEMTIEDPRFDFTPREVEYEDLAHVAANALDYYHDRMRFGRLFRMATRATIRDGGAPIKSMWAPPSIDMPDGGLIHRLLRIDDVFPDPTGTDFDSCSFVFHRVRASLDDLKSRKNADGSAFYKNLDKLPTGVGGIDNQTDQKRDTETQESYDARRTGVHTLHERWTPYNRVTIANRTHVIRHDTQNPLPIRMPFTMIRLIDDEDNILGISMMNLIDDLQEQTWSLLNALVDAVNLSINPPMLVDIEEDARSAEYDLYPGARLPARNAEQTVKVIQDIASLDKYNISILIDRLRDTMERVTGMNSQLAGLSQASTATEASINIRQGKNRVGAQISVADECWATLANKAYVMIQAFASREVRARLSGSRGRLVEFTPEHLVDMLITPSALSSERVLKDLERQDAQSLWDVVASAITDPMSQVPQLDITAVLKRVLESYGVNSEHVIVGPPLPPQFMQGPPPNGQIPPGEAPPLPLGEAPRLEPLEPVL